MTTKNILIGLAVVATVGTIWYFSKGKKTETTSGADGGCGCGCSGEKETEEKSGFRYDNTGGESSLGGSQGTRGKLKSR